MSKKGRGRGDRKGNNCYGCVAWTLAACVVLWLCSAVAV